MTETRKLAAILAADVVGYSRLAGADEDRTLARLRALRSDLIDPTIAVHNGRVVKRTGDGSLIEFRSVVDAVRCAIEVQNGMVERNAGVPPERRIEFRVGIHLGDVVEESDGDLMGDGVNIAARLEGIAKPGAICLSEDAYRQVRARLDLAVNDLGPTQLKNITEPVRVYSLEVGVPPNPKPASQAEPAGPEKSSSRLALPDKPSIAVLPFQNMSDDPAQEYFADGIAEDVITALSKFRWFFVIARNSSFVYKGQAVDVKRVGRELGVRYLLEGSVRKAGSRVRITVQLIEALTGNHLWAERYDRDLADIFAVQDEITQSVVGAIEPTLQRNELTRVRRKTPDLVDAYDLFQQGRYQLTTFTPEAPRIARESFREAIALAPDLVEAHVGLARYVLTEYLYGAHQTADFVEGERSAHRAIAIDDKEASAYYVVAFYYAHRGDIESAVAAARAAVDLNPNFALAHFRLGQILGFAGHLGASITAIDVGLRLSPNDPQAFFWLTFKGWAQYLLGRYEEALKTALAANRSRALPFVYRLLIATYGQLGLKAEAAAAIVEAKSIAEITRGNGVLSTLDPNLPYAGANSPHADRSQLALAREGLRKAGLRE